MSLGHPIEGTAWADRKECPPMGSIEDETRIIMDGSIKLEGEMDGEASEASIPPRTRRDNYNFFRRPENGK